MRRAGIVRYSIELCQQDGHVSFVKTQFYRYNRGASCQGAREVSSVPHVGMPARLRGGYEAFLTRTPLWTSGRMLGICAR